MNKIGLIFISAIALVQTLFSQSIQQLMDEVNQINLEAKVKQLSGEEVAIISGTPQTITNRVQSNNDLAATYIQEQLEALPNLIVELQEFNTVGKNVIATQIGQTNPENIYIICAHYDSVTSYCADDNATGVAAVIEIARLLSSQCTDNTIVYALWDEEEIGLRGANYYAQNAADETNGNTRDNIIAVVNMDMIGYDGDAPGSPGDNDFDIDVRNIASSETIKDDLLDILNTYTFDLNPIVVNPGTTASDHSRFWNQGYSAVLVGESWETNDQTPDYHSANDRSEDIDFQYMTELTKLVLAYTATKASLISLNNTVTSNPTNLISNETTATYQWYNCDTNTPISGATAQMFTPSADGNYAVEVSNGNCTELSSCVSFTALSTEEFTKKELSIYPNPVTSILKIENYLESDLTISINNSSGKAVMTTKTSQSNIEIDFSSLTKGIYFINVNTQSKSSTIKIVKE